MKIKDRSFYVFECSGREVYANRLIIGIDPNLDVYEGYDGEIATSETIPISSAERQELAEYMISRWEQFADKNGVK
jgi:hypothetical protein